MQNAQPQAIYVTANPPGEPAASMKTPALTKLLGSLGAESADSPKAGLIAAFRNGAAANGAATDGAQSMKGVSLSGGSPSSADTATDGALDHHAAMDDEAAGADAAASNNNNSANSAASAEAAAAAAEAAAAAAATAEYDDGYSAASLVKPSDPIVLDAVRMLAVSPTLPPAMNRPMWTSYDYTVLEKLYTGYASKVYKAVCKRSGQVVVLKSYQLSAICELYQHQIFREVALHASLAHEHVVRLRGAFQEGDFVVLVQEYAAGGNLFNLLQKYGGRLNEHVTVQMVLEPFLRVLQYLHTRGIAHRDIKPENILFDADMALKLADFGLAINMRRERAVTRAGTLDYMAPEVLRCPYKNRPDENKDKPHLHYGPTVDSWAVGVLAYELLVGCPPFYDTSRDRVEARIRAAAPTFPRTMSDAARSFISLALTKDASKRPTVLQLLSHPWIATFRARRSLRQVAGAPQGGPAGGSASAPSSPRAAPASPKAAAVAAVAPSSPRVVTTQQQQQQQQQQLQQQQHAASTSSSSTSSSSSGAKARAAALAAASGTRFAPPASSSVVLSSPRGLTASQQQQQQQQQQQPSGSTSSGAEGLRALASAKSTPLLVADARELRLGLTAATTAAAASGSPRSNGTSSPRAESPSAIRRKWLGLGKLFREGGSSGSAGAGSGSGRSAA